MFQKKKTKTEVDFEMSLVTGEKVHGKIKRKWSKINWNLVGKRGRTPLRWEMEGGKSLVRNVVVFSLTTNLCFIVGLG